MYFILYSNWSKFDGKTRYLKVYKLLPICHSFLVKVKQWLTYLFVWNEETLGVIKKWSGGVSKQRGVSTCASSTEQS